MSLLCGAVLSVLVPADLADLAGVVLVKKRKMAKIRWILSDCLQGGGL